MSMRHFVLGMRSILASLMNRTKFECKPKLFDNIRVVEIQIEKTAWSLVLHQKTYIQNLKILPRNGNYADSRSLHARFSWTTNTLPDKVVQSLKDKIDVVLQFTKLDRASLSLRPYSFASVASVHDHPSHPVYVASLSDKQKLFNRYSGQRINQNKLIVLHWEVI